MIKCLTFNLICQVLIIVVVILTIFVLPWLHFPMNQLKTTATTFPQCSDINLSIFYAWYKCPSGEVF